MKMSAVSAILKPACYLLVAIAVPNQLQHVDVAASGNSADVDQRLHSLQMRTGFPSRKPLSPVC
jgi:hypothetical protein